MAYLFETFFHKPHESLKSETNAISLDGTSSTDYNCQDRPPLSPGFIATGIQLHPWTRLYRVLLDYYLLRPSFAA